MTPVLIMKLLICVVLIVGYYNIFAHTVLPVEDLLYYKDFNTWKVKQAILLKNSEYDLLDRENLINEILDMSKGDRRAFASSIEVLLLHLLKYKCQPNYEPKSWIMTIQEQRRVITELIDHHPFQKNEEESTMNDVCGGIMRCQGKTYALMLFDETRGAVNAKNLSLKYMDEKKCLWSYDEIRNGTFFPERTGNC